MHSRRFFLQTLAAASAALPASAARLPIKKAVLLGMLPKELSDDDKFAMARDAGFEQVELHTVSDERQAASIKRASEKSGLPIHSVMNSDHWRYPLSSADPAVVAKCRSGMETSLRNAKLWGAETVLLVPAVVNEETRYEDAYKRSQAEIRKMLPLAEELKVVIAIENVWNKFLLSPLEFSQYVDSFRSPYVKAYFDVGNILLYGYPQDWIRTLGPRIAKVHLKDFSFKKRVAEFVNLRDGELNWLAVHRALTDIGYKGTATVELSGGDLAYLKDVSRRVDLILEGQ